MAGISQSKQVWHSTAMRSAPAAPVTRRLTSRSASSTSGSTASARRSRRWPAAPKLTGLDLRSNKAAP